MPYLKKVENAGSNSFTKQISSFGEQSLTGNQLKFTYCDAIDFSSRPYGNLFASFNFPITNGQKLDFATTNSNNAFNFFNNINQFIAVEIPENKYGELIDGKTFKLSFPINSGSSISVIDCYATYFLPDGSTDTKIMDKQYADTRSESAYFGIDPASNELLSSNIAYLFSNQISKPKLGLSYNTLSSSSYTFSTGFTSFSYYSIFYSNKSIPFNFIPGKKYRITITNILNDISGYETQSNLIYHDESRHLSSKFNATIGTDFISFQNTSQSTVVFDAVNTRSIRSFDYVCNISASSINLHTEVANSRNFIINKCNVLIEETIIQEGVWSRWTTGNKFIPSLGSTSGKQPAKFSSSNNLLYDQPVGILYLDKGFAVITDPTLVSNFAYNYSGATSSGYDGITAGNRYNGNTNFTQIYFNNSNIANSIYNSIYTEFIQAVTCIAMPNEFFISNNPTFTEVYGQDGVNNVNNDPVYISEIGLYNQYGELIAIAKTSEPIPKDKFNIAAFNINLKL